MKKSVYYSCFFLIVLSACVQKGTKEVSDGRLFPDGVYIQNIQLQLYPNTKNKQNLPFRTVSKIYGKNFEMMALTPLGTTAFLATGHLDRPENIKMTFYMERSKFLKDQFIRKTISNIQSFQVLKRTDLTAKIDHDFYSQSGITLEIYSYDSMGIPQQIRVKSKDWIASIYTESYKK